MNPWTGECAMGDKRVINPFLNLRQIHRMFFLLTAARLDWWVSHFFYGSFHFQYICTQTQSLPVLTEKQKHNFFRVFNLVNHNIWMLSSNDSVRRNEPQRAFWARVLTATSWHGGEQGWEEASSRLRATTTPAPLSQDFLSDRDSVTSDGWHVLMADAQKKK